MNASLSSRREEKHDAFKGQVTVAIDAMGGDHGPEITVPGAFHALSKHDDLRLILVGDETTLKNTIQSLSFKSYDEERLKIHHASEVVHMDESPALALRNKKDSSMRVAINLVKLGEAQACVSAGNTGALMATARFVLKMIDGVDRPAIVSSFPTRLPGKSMRMLDLGANVDSSAFHLVQFAVMGSVLASAIDHIENPKIYLLNIGEEDIKGNELVKETARILSEKPLVNFAGYIEGDAIFRGTADVVVADGFVGNVALKVTEGVARFIGRMVKDGFMANLYSKFIGLLAQPILRAMMKRIDPARYNGATLLGLKGTVVKSHGSANVVGFARAIDEAMLNAKMNVPVRIQQQIAQILGSSNLSEGE